MRRLVWLAAFAFVGGLSLLPGLVQAESKEEFLEALSSVPLAGSPTCAATVNCGSTSVSCSGYTSCIPTPRSCPGQRGFVTCDGVKKYCPFCTPSEELCGPQYCIDGATCTTDADCGCTQYGSCSASHRCGCR